jgi:hypothetical protein
MGTKGVGMSKGAIVAALLIASAQVARGFSPSVLQLVLRGLPGPAHQFAQRPPLASRTVGRCVEVACRSSSSGSSGVDEYLFPPELQAQLASEFPNWFPANGLAVAPTRTTTDGLKDEEIIARAKTFLLEGNGFYAAPQPDLFAQDFVFRAPVVGPLCKNDYLETMSLFKLWEALPDMQANSYGWCVVPKTDDATGDTTVRVYVKNTGTHTGHLDVGSLTIPPSGKSYEGTTESIAITLNPDGKVKLLTAGYVVDRLGGNGGGLGAVAGILVAIGLQVPKPYGKIFRFSQWLGNTFGKRFGPRTISKKEDLPAWWTDTRIGSQGL